MNEILDFNGIITIPPSPFLNRLGYGTGVSVMQLVRSRRAVKIRSPWAYKMLSERVNPKNIYDRIKAEVDLLRLTLHSNIVAFHTFSNGKILYLGMDLSLGEMIEKRVEDDREPFSPKQILKVAADIANALDYLHTKMQILHGDIKSYNILVNGDFVICKLSDFGVTLPLDANGVLDKQKAGEAAYFGSEPWAAPEVFHNGDISCKTDIWPLGLTLWEMMGLMPPHTLSDSRNDSVHDLGDSLDSVADYFSGRYGTRPSVPVNISEKQYMHPLALFYCCTETMPAMRPTAQHLCIAARDMLDHLSYGVWFPHLVHRGPLCGESCSTSSLTARDELFFL